MGPGGVGAGGKGADERGTGVGLRPGGVGRSTAVVDERRGTGGRGDSTSARWRSQVAFGDRRSGVGDRRSCLETADRGLAIADRVWPSADRGWRSPIRFSDRRSGSAMPKIGSGDRRSGLAIADRGWRSQIGVGDAQDRVWRSQIGSGAGASTFLSRNAAAAVARAAGPALKPPYWLRLTRSGDSLAAATSPSGAAGTWTTGLRDVARARVLDLQDVGRDLARGLEPATADDTRPTPRRFRRLPQSQLGVFPSSANVASRVPLY